MKQATLPVKSLAIVLLIAGFSFSCKKKTSDPEPEPEPTVTTNGTMTAKVNGNNWTSIRNSAQLRIDDGQQISAFAINGETSADLFSFAFDIPTANTNLLVGTHDEGIAKDDAVMIYVIKTSGGGTLIQHAVDEATFNITAVDNTAKKASGTFTLKGHKIGSTAAADSIKITNGVFTDITFVTTHE